MANLQKRQKTNYVQKIDDIIPSELFIPWLCSEIHQYYRDKHLFSLAFTNSNPGKKTFIMKGQAKGDNYEIKISAITSSFEIKYNNLVSGKVLKDLGCLFTWSFLEPPSNIEELVKVFFTNMSGHIISSVKKPLIFDRLTRLLYLRAHKRNTNSQDDESGSDNLCIFYDLLDRVIDPSLTTSLAFRWLENAVITRFTFKTATKLSIFLDLEFASFSIMSRDQDAIRAMYRQKIAQFEAQRNKK